MAAAWLADAAVDTAGSQGAQWLRTLVPVNQIYTLVAVVLYSAVSLDAVLWLLPLLTFYSTFAILLVVTAQMLRSKKRLSDVQTLSSMLRKFTDVMFDAESATSAYSWKSLKPYATFFVVLPLCVAALSVADDAWIPSPEMMALSAIASATCFFALSDRYDKLAVCSIFIDVVFTILPGAIKQLPQIPLIRNILWLTIGPGYALDLPIPGLHLMIGVPSLAFFIVPLIFVRMARKRSWRGTYQILVPHLICFFWWRLSVAFFARSTWLGLTRAMVGWIGLIILLPVLSIFFVVYAVYLLFTAISLGNVLKAVTTVALVLGASAYAMWSRSGFHFGSFFSLDGKSPLSRAALILVLVLGSCLPFAVIFNPFAHVSDVDSNALSWTSYIEHCAGPGLNPATCAHFAGAVVTGPGTVVKVSVSRIENPAEAITAWLPSPADEWLRCAYGSSYPADCDSITDSTALRDACRFNTRRGRYCHMRHLDRYTYDVTLKVSRDDGSTETVRVVADDWFRKPAVVIEPGQEVNVRVRLSGAVSVGGLTLRLSSIQYYSQEDGETSTLQGDKSTVRILAAARTAVHAVWNFFLNPVFSFL